MVEKNKVMACRRKKSNITTPANNKANKRLKTEQENPAEYRNGILQGIRVLLGKMDDKNLLAVMMYVGSMDGGEKQKSTTSSQPAVTTTATATATDKSTATATATANPTTTDAANATSTTNHAVANPTTEANLPASASASASATTVPPSPQDEVIQLTKNTRPLPDNIVPIDPLCFLCDGRTELEATKCKNKSINAIVNSIVQNDLTPQQRAFSLKQAMVHPDVRALAKSAGLIDDQDFIKKTIF